MGSYDDEFIPPTIFENEDPYRPVRSTPTLRSIEPSVTEKKACKTKAQKEAERKAKLERLEDRHTRTLLELESARNLLHRYNQVHRVLTIALVSVVALVGVSLALVMLGFSNAWIGLSLGVAGTLAMNAMKNDWYNKHRLSTEKQMNNAVTMAYIDPALNVKLAEAKYSTALRELTEFTT